MAAADLLDFELLTDDTTLTDDLMARRRWSMPGLGQHRLSWMVGDWDMAMRFWPTADAQPVTAPSGAIRTQVRAVFNGRWLLDEAVGRIGGSPYHRQGIWGYHPLERRYERITWDNSSVGLMPYHSQPEPDLTPLVLDGQFTEAGFGPQLEGHRMLMRLLLDRHTDDSFSLRLELKPPAQDWFLNQQQDFTRH